MLIPLLGWKSLLWFVLPAIVATLRAATLYLGRAFLAAVLLQMGSWRDSASAAKFRPHEGHGCSCMETNVPLELSSPAIPYPTSRAGYPDGYPSSCSCYLKPLSYSLNNPYCT